MIRKSFIGKIFPNSEFLSNTLVLIAGTVIAQAIPILLQPILRRYYSPDDFGAFAIYYSIISIVVIMANFRYEAAIVLPKDDKESLNVLSLSLVLSFLFCMLLFVLFLFFKQNFCSLINFPDKYSDFLYLLPFSAMLFSFYQALNYWLIRKKLYKALSVNKITRRSVEGITQLTSGYKNFSMGLFIGDFVGTLANAITGFWQAKKNGFNTALISKKDMLYVLKRYQGFPINNFAPTLLSAVAITLPFFFVNKFYSPSDVGYLDLTRLVLSIPLAFISATISQVLFQEVTDLKNNKKSITGNLKKTLYIIASIAGVEYVIIHFFAPPLFAFVFGDSYYVSGKYSQILIYAYITSFVISTFSGIFISFEKLKLLSLWQISYFAMICSLYFCKNLSLNRFLQIYTFLEIIMGMVYCIMAYKVVMGYENTISKETENITKPHL